MDTKQTHMPNTVSSLPWHIETTNGRDGIYGRDPERPGCLAEITDRIWDHKHAALIIRACNSHAALLAALKDCITEEGAHCFTTTDMGVAMERRLLAINYAARAAIAQAEKD